MADDATKQTKETKTADLDASSVAEPKVLTREEERALLETMTVEDRVQYHYMHGQGSIQDIARIYRMEVDEVLDLIGQSEMKTVRQSHGDLIDASEAGPGAQMNYEGKQFGVQFSTN